MQHRIFDGFDLYSMAVANTHLATLRYRSQGELINKLIIIKSLDDPYYMKNLSPGTYSDLVDKYGYDN